MKQEFLSIATFNIDPLVLATIRKLRPDINMSGLVRDLLASELSKLKGETDERESNFSGKVS